MWIEVKYQVILFVSWKTELIHAACSTTVIHVLLQRNCSHDKLSIRQILLFIPNMKSKSACSLSRPTRTKAAGWRGTQGDYQRAVVRTTIQRCFQSCDTLILLEAFPCNCLETIRVSLASALTEFVAVSLPMSSLLLCLSTRFTLHLVSALILILLSLSFTSLFFTFMFLLSFFLSSFVPPHNSQPQQRKAWADGPLLELAFISMWAAPAGWATIPITIQREHEYCTNTQLSCSECHLWRMSGLWVV